MFRFPQSRALLPLGLVGVAIAVGCTVNVDDNPTSTRDDGTVEVVESRASALVTGRVDASISGDIRIQVNGSSRDVVLAPDRSFVVREVPSGDVTFDCEALSIRGSIRIEAVKAGEQIEVSVRVEGSSLVIVVTRRSESSEPPREVAETTGGPLEIRANNVCYYLRAGSYDRDIVILGNNVSVVGASCTTPSVLTGSLTVRGNNAVVQDVDLRGEVTIQGNNTRVQSSCSRCFADACYQGRRSESSGNGNGSNGAGSSSGGSSTSSSGATSSGGGPVDAGAGCTQPTCDAGSDATDAGAADATDGGL